MNFESLKELYEAEAPENAQIVLNHYSVEKRIGQGSFAKIYQCRDTKTNKKFALKVEKIIDNFPTTPKEYETLKVLEGVNGVPAAHQIVKVKGTHYAVVMELLGMNLASVMQKLGRPLGLKSVLMVADQLLGILEEVHRRGVLHRDIKPENILIGSGNNSSQVYLVDYGLSKMWRNSDGSHVPLREGKSLVGTARFASLNNHQGKEQGKRDDLESLLYTLIYLLNKNLPWKETPAKLTSSLKYEYIESLKVSFGKNEICMAAPLEFFEIFSHIRKLDFTETPNYCFLRSLVRKAFHSTGQSFDQQFEWSSLLPKSQESIVTSSQDLRTRLQFSPEEDAAKDIPKETRQHNPLNKQFKTDLEVKSSSPLLPKMNAETPNKYKKEIGFDELSQVSDEERSAYSVISVLRSNDANDNPVEDTERPKKLNFSEMIPDFEKSEGEFDDNPWDLKEEMCDEFDPEEDRVIDKYYILNKKNLAKKSKTELDFIESPTTPKKHKSDLFNGGLNWSKMRETRSQELSREVLHKRAGHEGALKISRGANGHNKNEKNQFRK